MLSISSIGSTSPCRPSERRGADFLETEGLRGVTVGCSATRDCGDLFLRSFGACEARKTHAAPPGEELEAEAGRLVGLARKELMRLLIWCAIACKLQDCGPESKKPRSGDVCRSASTTLQKLRSKVDLLFISVWPPSLSPLQASGTEIHPAPHRSHKRRLRL